MHGVFPTIGLFEPDAEYATDRLTTHGGAELLAAFAAGPGRGDAAASLAIGEQDRRAFTDRLHVEIGQRAAAGVGDVTRGGIDGADFRVPQAPEVEKALLTPGNVSATPRVPRVGRAWQVHARGGLEVLTAVLAVAHAGPGPAIAEDAVHLIGRDDLLGHFGHELEIVRA